jgi:hypothetical protein
VVIIIEVEVVVDQAQLVMVVQLLELVVQAQHLQ